MAAAAAAVIMAIAAAMITAAAATVIKALAVVTLVPTPSWPYLLPDHTYSHSQVAHGV